MTGVNFINNIVPYNITKANMKTYMLYKQYPVCVYCGKRSNLEICFPCMREITGV